MKLRILFLTLFLSLTSPVWAGDGDGPFPLSLTSGVWESLDGHYLLKISDEVQPKVILSNNLTKIVTAQGEIQKVLDSGTSVARLVDLSGSIWVATLELDPQGLMHLHLGQASRQMDLLFYPKP